MTEGTSQTSNKATTIIELTVADNTPSHYEASLQRDIDLIKSKINDMFQLDKRALEDSLKALVEGNKQLAYGVILRDQQVDELEKEVDRLCLEFMVRSAISTNESRGGLGFISRVFKTCRAMLSA